MIYSVADASKRVGVLTPPKPTVSRWKNQDPDEFCLQIQDYVFRCLEANVDAPYYILGLLSKDIILLCSTVINDLEFLQSNIPSVVGGAYREASTEHLGKTKEVLEEFPLLGTHDRNAALVKLETLLGSTVNKYASARTPASVEATRTELHTRATAVGTNIGKLAAQLRYLYDGADNFIRCDTRGLHGTVQAKHLARVFGSYSEENTQAHPDLNIDSVLSMSLLKSATAGKKDITRNKLEAPFSLITDSDGYVMFSLDDASVDPGYEIHSYDVLLGTDSGEYVGYIRKHSAGVYSLVDRAPFAPYPSNVAVVTLGNASMTLLRPYIYKYMAIVEGTTTVQSFLQKLDITISSGALYNEVGPFLVGFLQGLKELRASLCYFRYHRVASVDALLTWLEQDKLGYVLYLLRNAQFLKLLNLTSAELFTSASVYAQLDSLTKELADSSPIFVRTIGFDPLQDYTKRDS